MTLSGRTHGASPPSPPPPRLTATQHDGNQTGHHLPQNPPHRLFLRLLGTYRLCSFRQKTTTTTTTAAASSSEQPCRRWSRSAAACWRRARRRAGRRQHHGRSRALGFEAVFAGCGRVGRGFHGGCVRDRRHAHFGCWASEASRSSVG